MNKMTTAISSLGNPKISLKWKYLHGSPHQKDSNAQLQLHSAHKRDACVGFSPLPPPHCRGPFCRQQTTGNQYRAETKLFASSQIFFFNVHVVENRTWAPFRSKTIEGPTQGKFKHFWSSSRQSYLFREREQTKNESAWHLSSDPKYSLNAAIVQKYQTGQAAYAWIKPAG